MKFLERLKITLEISTLLIIYCVVTFEYVCADALKRNDITVKQLSKYGLSKEEITLIKSELNIVSEVDSTTITDDESDGENNKNENDNSKKEVVRQANGDIDYETGEAFITEQKGKSLLVDSVFDEDDDSQVNGDIDYATREASITEQDGKNLLADGSFDEDDDSQANGDIRYETRESSITEQDGKNLLVDGVFDEDDDSQANGDIRYETRESSITEQDGKGLMVDDGFDEDDDSQVNGDIGYDTRESSITEQDGKNLLVDSKDLEGAESVMMEEVKERPLEKNERNGQELESLKGGDKLSDNIEEDQVVSDDEDEVEQRNRDNSMSKFMINDYDNDDDDDDGDSSIAKSRKRVKNSLVGNNRTDMDNSVDEPGDNRRSSDKIINRKRTLNNTSRNKPAQKRMNRFIDDDMHEDADPEYDFDNDDDDDDGDSSIAKSRKKAKNALVGNNGTDMDNSVDEPEDNRRSSDKIINRKRTLNNTSRNKPAQKSRNRFIDDDMYEDADPEYDYDNDDDDDDGDSSIAKSRKRVKNSLVGNNRTDMDNSVDEPGGNRRSSDKIINRKRTLNNTSRNKPAQKSRNRFIDDDMYEDADQEYDFDNDDPEEDSDQSDSYDEDSFLDERNRNNSSYNNAPRNISPLENYTKNPAGNYKNGYSPYDSVEYNQAKKPDEFDNESHPNERNDNLSSHGTPIYKNREIVGGIDEKRHEIAKRNISSNPKKNANISPKKKQKKTTPARVSQRQVIYWPYMYYGCNLPKNCTNLFYYPAYQCMQSCNKLNVQCVQQKTNNDRCYSKHYANKCMDEATKRRLEFEAEPFVKNRCRK